MNIRELSPDEVTFEYQSSQVAKYRGFKGPEKVIGQPRGMKALKMGMELNHRGYNIYLSGDYGTGRHSAIKEIAAALPPFPLYDLVFTYCFRKPESPLPLLLPSGQGILFYNDMEAVSSLIKSEKKEEALAYLKKMTEQSYSGEVVVFIHQVEEDIYRNNESDEKYKVNLVLNNSKNKTRPLVFESHPDQANIFGYLSGNSKYTHLNIIPGSLIEALGGFFVVDAGQVYTDKTLWEDLKRFAYSSNMILSRYSDKAERRFIKISLKDIPVKIILTGSDDLFEKLSDNDESFLSLFHLSAQFDYSMDASEENLRGTVAYIEKTATDSNLLPLTNGTIAALLTHSAWMVENRKELTTQMSRLSALLYEADIQAKSRNALAVEAQDVENALKERSYTSAIYEDRINKEISSGEMIISLSGTKVGIVNGLAVIDRGQDSFGTPTVISATVAPGSEGIVNIEHEAGLSGEIHDKGLLILEGYLRKRYARTFPLSIYAGICFEQSYAEIDGDSASSSELFALLSAIGEFPIRQDIAITGSVNQAGMIQPVGGINEKITGFYHVCSQNGLTGSQGVIIPRKNIDSLILDNEIIVAIKLKKFHIYPIETIDQGMEILTHREAGDRNQKGVFPPSSLNRIIEVRLKRLFEFSKTIN